MHADFSIDSFTPLNYTRFFLSSSISTFGSALFFLLAPFLIVFSLHVCMPVVLFNGE
jgi:hypothetical protein